MYLKERWVYPRHVLLQRLLRPMDTNPPVCHVTPISFNLFDYHDFPEHDINPQEVKADMPKSDTSSIQTPIFEQHFV
jgi:hypothetical protein